MATYGYAGDFSSDDDEKVEQVRVPPRYDDTDRPSKKQIEETIETIKRLPYDQEINLSDDVLAGVLDYYKTQRGPIVDSTRKLYNKIALRLVRGDQSKESVSTDDVKELNGNNNNNNTNNINLASQQTAADAFSSDDDDIEPTGNAKKFDSRVVYNKNIVDDDDKMEVDTETPWTSGPARENKPIDLVTTDEEQDNSSTGDDDDDNLSETGEGESDILEVTPIKPPANSGREKEAVEVLMAMRPNTPKHAESSQKRQPMAHSTPKDTTAKKPYTRSQRVTRSAVKNGRDMLQVYNKNLSSSNADAFIEKKQKSRFNYTLLAVSILMLVFACLAYYYRSNVLNTIEPLFRRKITF